MLYCPFLVCKSFNTSSSNVLVTGNPENVFLEEYTPTYFNNLRSYENFNFTFHFTVVHYSSYTQKTKSIINVFSSLNATVGMRM
jgi:hypothetical protein